MGILVQGQWREEELPTETDSAGAFRRSESQFRNRITRTAPRGSKPNRVATIFTLRTTARGLTAC